MEKELARHLALTAWKSFTDLTRVIPLLQQHCTDVERQTYVKAIGAAGAAINDEILDRVFAAYPDLKQDLETKIAKYQKWI